MYLWLGLQVAFCKEPSYVDALVSSVMARDGWCWPYLYRLVCSLSFPEMLSWSWSWPSRLVLPSSVGSRQLQLLLTPSLLLSPLRLPLRCPWHRKLLSKVSGSPPTCLPSAMAALPVTTQHACITARQHPAPLSSNDKSPVTLRDTVPWRGAIFRC
jgi:hypothetical protein